MFSGPEKCRVGHVFVREPSYQTSSQDYNALNENKLYFYSFNQALYSIKSLQIQGHELNFMDDKLECYLQIEPGNTKKGCDFRNLAVVFLLSWSSFFKRNLLIFSGVNAELTN